MNKDRFQIVDGVQPAQDGLERMRNLGDRSLLENAAMAISLAFRTMPAFLEGSEMPPGLVNATDSLVSTVVVRVKDTRIEQLRTMPWAAKIDLDNVANNFINIFGNKDADYGFNPVSTAERDPSFFSLFSLKLILLQTRLHNFELPETPIATQGLLAINQNSLNFLDHASLARGLQDRRLSQYDRNRVISAMGNIRDLVRFGFQRPTQQ